MTLTREELERLRLAQNKTTQPPLSSAPVESQSEDSVISLPHVASSHGASKPLASQLDLVAMRDRLIQAELLRLQRTLSRQNFRGAESARRLVRKLARKAEQNVADLESLQRSVN